MTKIRLIRHAESEANAGEKTDNPRTIQITSHGFAQAHELIGNFKPDQLPDAIFYSNFLRTKQTALPLLQKYPQLLHEELDFIHEFNFLCEHKCKGTSTQERKKRVEYFWSQNDSYRDGKDSETVADLFKRVSIFYQYIKTLKKEFYVFFTHGQFMHSVLYATKDPSILTNTDNGKQQIRQSMNHTIKNTQIIELTYEHGLDRINISHENINMK